MKKCVPVMFSKDFDGGGKNRCNFGARSCVFNVFAFFCALCMLCVLTVSCGGGGGGGGDGFRIGYGVIDGYTTGSGDGTEPAAQWPNADLADSEVFIKDRIIDIPSTLWVCDHEVTQEEYQNVMGSNPSLFQGANKPPASGSGEEQTNRPVEQVSWYNAIVYCNKLSIKDSLTPCYTIDGSVDPSTWGEVPTTVDATWDAVTCDFTANGYRLPTEAEWEYAARGGNLTTVGQTKYAGSDTYVDVAWYSGNSNAKTHEVKRLASNGLGLYDMSGNVWEWCWDWYGVIDASTPATGAPSGSRRVSRGGSMGNNPDSCTVFKRISDNPQYNSHLLGFRVVRTL